MFDHGKILEEGPPQQPINDPVRERTRSVVSALATVGRVDEAIERLLALDAALPRLLAEEWSVEGGHALGNAPLLWSHIELIRALYAIDGATAG
jgi:GH15 family glucan-1,4-alpha-glucosidase